MNAILPFNRRRLLTLRVGLFEETPKHLRYVQGLARVGMVMTPSLAWEGRTGELQTGIMGNSDGMKCAEDGGDPRLPN